MRSFLPLFIVHTLANPIEQEAIAKAISIFAGSQTAWNDSISAILDKMRQVEPEKEQKPHSIPWLFQGGYHTPIPQVPDVHSVHPDESRKSFFGFSWGKRDAPSRHDASGQNFDHRIPGSRVRGLHTSLAVNPSQLQANLVGDGLNLVFGRKTNSWFDLLNIGGGKLDEVLKNADGARKSIERLIKEVKLPEQTKKKLLGALDLYQDAIIQDMLYTGFLQREYIPERQTNAEERDADALIPNAISTVTNFIHNLAANKELPVSQAIHSVEHRIGGLKTVETIFNTLPDSKQKKEIGKAINTLKQDLLKNLDSFTKQMGDIASDTLQKGSKRVSAAASKPRRRLQAVDTAPIGEGTYGDVSKNSGIDVSGVFNGGELEEIEKLEKDLQGVFGDIVSTALQAKNTLGGASAGGMDLGAITGLSGFGNKLIKDTVQSSLLNQIQAFTGIPVATIKTALSSASGTTQQATSQVKNLLNSVGLGLDQASGNKTGSPSDVKSQMSQISNLLKNKMGGSEGLFDMLKKELGPAVADNIMQGNNKILLSIVEELEQKAEMSLQQTEIAPEIEVELNTTDEETIKILTHLESMDDVNEKELAGLIAEVKAEKEEAEQTTSDSEKLASTMFDRADDEIQDAAKSMGDAAEDAFIKAGEDLKDAFNRQKEFLAASGRLEEVTQAIERIDEAQSTIHTEIDQAASELASQTTELVNTAALEAVKSTMHAEVDSAVSTLKTAVVEQANSEEFEEAKATIHAEVDESVTKLGDLAVGVGNVAKNSLESAGQAIAEVADSLITGNKDLTGVARDAALKAADKADEKTKKAAEKTHNTAEKIDAAADRLDKESENTTEEDTTEEDIPVNHVGNKVVRILAPVAPPPGLSTPALPPPTASIKDNSQPATSRPPSGSRSYVQQSNPAISTNSMNMIREEPKRKPDSGPFRSFDFFRTSSPFYRAINRYPNAFQVAPAIPSTDESPVKVPEFAPGYYGYRVNLGRQPWEFGAMATPPRQYTFLPHPAFIY